MGNTWCAAGREWRILLRRGTTRFLWQCCWVVGVCRPVRCVGEGVRRRAGGLCWWRSRAWLLVHDQGAQVGRGPHRPTDIVWGWLRRAARHLEVHLHHPRAALHLLLGHHSRAAKSTLVAATAVTALEVETRHHAWVPASERAPHHDARSFRACCANAATGWMAAAALRTWTSLTRT